MSSTSDLVLENTKYLQIDQILNPNYRSACKCVRQLTVQAFKKNVAQNLCFVSSRQSFCNKINQI